MNVTTYQAVLLVITYIVLFLFGLRSFSKEVQQQGAGRLNAWLSRFTAHRWQGFLLGAGITAVIQSSSAVSAMTVAMVEAGAFSFTNSLAVLLGANVGTTSTAWLVSLKATFLGPIFILLGTLIGFVPHRIHLIGKSLFYFGFILFALQLLSGALEPIGKSPEIVDLLRKADNVLLAVAVGALVTALVQSSSVVSGLVVVLVQTQVIDLNEGVAIIIGSNVGTTSTALIAAAQMGSAARLSALANFIFNLTGTLAFIPLVDTLSGIAVGITGDLAFQVAYAHLIFNVVIACFFLPILKPFAYRLSKWRGGPEPLPKTRQ